MNGGELFDLDYHEAVEKFRVSYLSHHLEKNGGNVSATVKSVKISRAGYYKAMGRIQEGA